MKRKILMFRKETHDTIQGIMGATNGKNVVYLGMPCDGNSLHGGGVVSDMELIGNGAAILIRKTTPDGKPLRVFGSLATDPRGGKVRPFEADGVLFPFSLTRGALFEDVEDAPKAQATQSQQPAQGQKQGK